MKHFPTAILLMLLIAADAIANPTAAGASDMMNWMSSAPTLDDYVTSGKARPPPFRQPPPHGAEFLPPPLGGGSTVGPGGLSVSMLAKGAESGARSAASLVKVIDSEASFRKAFDALSDIDTEFDPDFSLEGSPLVPSACAEEEASRGDC